ncbi:MAG: DUF11 domain-containing protein, partial [Microthrixaceae bacterium]|nr:DUF11 domain-containing protein [Microthrixaceae bacterium]
SDPGTFDLHIDDTVKKAAATHNGTTGPVTVTPGNHTIAETAAGSTLGGEYDSSVVCVSDTREDDEVLEVIEGEVTVEVGDNVVCTFTNTRKPADLTIVKNPGSEFVLPGGTASFSITVSNAAGGGTAHDVVVSDPVPTGVTYVSSQDGVCGEAGTSCELGDIAPGASVTFTINYLVGSDPDLMVVHNAATVTSPDDPESPGDDADIPVARMSIVKTGTPSSYSAEGDVLTYTYVVSNTGGATLTGVTVIDDRIPTESIDCNDEGEGNGQPLTLAVEESVSCVATYAVKAADMTADSVDNVGTADSDQTGTVFDTWSIPRAALSIEKVATSKGPFALGDTINYEITVTNVGTASLHGVTITEAGEGATLDDECPAAPTGEGVILHKGESVTCTATHTVTQADFDAGSYTNVATADSDETPPVDGDETVTTPDPAVDLAIVKSLSSSSIVAGQQATYTLTVSNNGPATATSVKVTDKMPAGLTATAAAGLGWSCKIENNTVECSTAAVIAAKAQLPPITITASVSADARGNIVNTATVGGTQVDRDPSNNTSTVTNPITVVLAATVEATTTTTIAQRAPVTVAAAPTRVAQRTGTPLATTGTTSSLLLIVAGSLMVIGSVALGVRRRRLR